VPAEDAAKAAKRGIWAGAFDVPADWRKERKVLTPSASRTLQPFIP
jgi:endonuclease YncB( thermonuclease family)